jgi:hypothetical protein
LGAFWVYFLRSIAWLLRRRLLKIEMGISDFRNAPLKILVGLIIIEEIEEQSQGLFRNARLRVAFDSHALSNFAETSGDLG